MQQSNSQAPRCRRFAFSLPELALTLAICAVTALVLAPVVTRYFRPSRRQQHVASNTKMMALGFLSYTQDYDEKFPPVSGFVPRVYKDGEELPPVEVSWGPGREVAPGVRVLGLLSPYVHADSLFLGDPYVERGFFGIRRTTYRVRTLGYMYNDLLATEPQGRLAAVAGTVLAVEAEDQYWNAGHSWLPEEGPYPSRANAAGKCDPGEGATVRNAPLRRSKGANYAFADGHTKWFKAVTTARRPHPDVYFPPHSSAATKADPAAGEPVPGGNMKAYAATFHLR